MKNIYFIVLIGLVSACTTTNKNWESDSNDAEFLHRAQEKYTDVIVYDIFSPPQAARNYAYSSIAAYEVARLGNSDFVSLAEQLRDFTPIPSPPLEKEINYPLASLTAFLAVSKALIFSEQKIMDFQAEILSDFEKINMPKSVYDASIIYGKLVANHILKWVDTDNYKESRSFPKYSVNDDPARWRPTPPGYMDGIEPAWRDIRPFVIDSAQQFQPPFPTEYSLDKKSTFYKELLEVYNAVNKATDEHKEIASFWDCNPFVLNVTGHVMHATKKITPGGHWMGIATIACRNSGADFIITAQAYALTAIALNDGFISCWDEKYRSNLTRPETVINENLDEDWVPLLQTPPFPEYTSGHSVISNAAAVALTSLFGDNFAFDDDTEVQFGLPIRSFTSFFHAANEAAISRLYGGIHYRPAIDNGATQGKRLGSFVVKNLNFKTS